MPYEPPLTITCSQIDDYELARQRSLQTKAAEDHERKRREIFGSNEEDEDLKRVQQIH